MDFELQVFRQISILVKLRREPWLSRDPGDCHSGRHCHPSRGRNSSPPLISEAPGLRRYSEHTRSGLQGTPDLGILGHTGRRNLSDKPGRSQPLKLYKIRNSPKIWFKILPFQFLLLF